MEENKQKVLFSKIKRIHRQISSDINEPPSIEVRDFDDEPTPFIDAAAHFPHLAKSLAGYAEILDDLKRGIASLKRIHLLGIEDDVLLEALFSQAITNYGRCFTPADRRKLKLDKGSPWILNGTIEEAIHDQVMHLRHQLVAHAGITSFRETKVLLLVDREQNPTKLKGISSLGRSLTATDFGTSLRLATHFEALAARVHSKVNELCAKITEKAKTELNLNTSG
jgi:hypothetical protein